MSRSNSKSFTGDDDSDDSDFEIEVVEKLGKSYHPNIDVEGNVCLNILRKDWKPVLDIQAVVHGLIFLYLEPNPDDPLNHDAAAVLRRDKRQFARNVDQALRGNSIDGERYPRNRTYR